ncbi:methyl-accepting chemotaxis protein [Chthonobacter albigriseus]|uniref:methyl-accepting chemotaxis protein n=1 Tax=Chthonobacter albigriseus TaxID=1683161 RepID=UPI0015EFC84C|nr:methyl-accepting chemotaxis protein [Chthonobacter albigriseus]
MFSTLKIRLPVALVGLALASAAVMGGIGWFGAKDGLEREALDRLAFAADARQDLLGMQAARISSDVQTVSEMTVVSSSIAELDKNLALNPADFEKTLAYFKAGAPAERLARDGADSQTMYGFRHAKVHATLKSAMEKGGYADIMILDGNGRVIYSVAKGDDFALSMDDPALAGTALGGLFKSMQEGPADTFVFADFQPYPLAGGELSAFLGHPIERKSNAAMNTAQETLRVGYMVFRLSPAVFDTVMSGRKGLGQSGETFAVGPDGLLRTNPPLSGAKAGEPVTVVGIDGADMNPSDGIHFQRADTLFTAATAESKVFGATWTIYATQADAEVLATATTIRNQMTLIGSIIVAATVAIGFLTARSIIGPIAKLTQALRAMASGHDVEEIAGRHRKDEIGEIARAVEQIREMTHKDAQSRAEATESERSAREAERRALTESMANDFEARVGSIVGKVADAALQLERAAGDMAGLAQQASQRSSTVADATEAASGDVRSVAAAADQLFASIREVSDLIARSGEIAGDADRHAASTNTLVASLSETAARIGTVVDIIQSIAEQTNLLALNATIEAARAGEAGRGFSVVAGEVKGLAGQTAKATEEIGSQIAAMRAATTNAVDAITRIRSVVGEIGQAVTSVASAIEEQSAATSEIARAAQNAARGTNTVSTNISDVRSAVGTTDEAASRVVDQARSLGKDAADLQSAMKSFVSQILAA